MALLGGIIKRNRNVPSELGFSEGRFGSLARPVRAVGGLLGLLAVCFLRICEPSAQGQVAEEYQLKAAFLKNFATFVEWPTNSFPDSNTHITFGVLGDDPFKQSLDGILKNEEVKKRKLDLKRYMNVAEIGLCHILFISQSESGKLDKILAELKGRNILTVGETDRFVERGGIIQFVLEGKKIQFKINTDNASSEQLEISSKLLRYSTIITNK